MTCEQVGELAALGTAMLWTLSTLAWTSAGRHIGALPVSFIRLGITCIFLMGYGLLVRGVCLPTDAAPRTWLLLTAAGFFGFFQADLCLFKSFLLIGPRLSLLVQSLVPPLTVLISWVLRGDRLTLSQWVGMGVTLMGVVWVVLEEPDQGDRPQDETSATLGNVEGQDQDQFDRPDRTRPMGWGLFLALLAAIGQAVGSVLSKEGIGDYDAGAATFIRVIGALVGYVLLVTIFRRWATVVSATRRIRIMGLLALGALVGPFLGVVLYLEALRRCHAGVVTTIVATMPVLILPFVILLYREKVSLRAAGGALIAVAGVALLVLWG
jgi:drug/metabolite transporter (DMT)-like permease